jgi:putative restriction endonuclease
VNKDLKYYCQKFSRLKVDKSRGIAPHKPIMLLSVIEQFEQRKITVNQIYPSASLIATFSKYWSYLGSERHQDSSYLPFFYLKSDEFWHLKIKSGLEEVISGFKPKSLKSLQTLILYAFLDDELFLLLQDSVSRSVLINTLVETWFSHKKEQVNELFRIDAFQEFQNKLKESGGKVYSVEDLKNEDQVIVRDAAFRKIVISVYNYRCSFCGLKIINSLGQNIVDGSHIKPFSEFRDDRIDNGISLCKNHHWAFDRGWFSIDENYRISVSKDLHEITPNNRAMIDFDGGQIILPNQELYYPRLDALQWHFENIFQKENPENLLFDQLA